MMNLFQQIVMSFWLPLMYRISPEVCGKLSVPRLRKKVDLSEYTFEKYFETVFGLIQEILER